MNLDPVTVQKITLNPGQVLILRGDVAHFGMGYGTFNTRVHCYCEPSAAVDDAGVSIFDYKKAFPLPYKEAVLFEPGSWITNYDEAIMAFYDSLLD